MLLVLPPSYYPVNKRNIDTRNVPWLWQRNGQLGVDGEFMKSPVHKPIHQHAHNTGGHGDDGGDEDDGDSGDDDDDDGNLIE